MSRPVIIDLFGGQGGAGEGWHRAGFDVVGVDSDPNATRRHPHPTITADWRRGLDMALQLYRGDVAAVHASPPCQRYSHGTVAGHSGKHPDLIGPVRAVLETLGLPYVIENVPRAPLRDAITLCGSMFGLTAVDTDGTRLWLKRHRLFESNLLLSPPGPCRHPSRAAGWHCAGVYGGARRDRDEARLVRRGGYVPRSEDVCRELMGIGWMTAQGLRESIPPAYTEHLGHQVLAHLGVAA